MPDIAKFYVRNCLIGFAWSAVFVGALLYFNVANLWSLVSQSDIGLMAALLLFFFNGIVFAGAQCGVAIMLMTERDDDQDPPRGMAVTQSLPVTIR